VSLSDAPTTLADVTSDLPGLFVSFEGGDGAGKSTQARLLGEWLTGLGREVVLTPAGRDLLLACWPQMEAFHAIVAQGISDEDLATTRRVLLAMTANLRT